mmetsp:Transcript_24143/g.40478  ORF Transcript_24143/g.40478 Transcript_24143/m.40478 type:complete len:86 (-) Transcript_24143:23-280(-)
MPDPECLNECNSVFSSSSSSPSSVLRRPAPAYFPLFSENLVPAEEDLEMYDDLECDESELFSDEYVPAMSDEDDEDEQEEDEADE